MTIVLSRHQGTSPLLISIPHDGRRIPPRMAARMTQAGRAIPDTDWHVRELYRFATLTGATVVAAKYSRYVIDLNRSSEDEVLYPGHASTGLCPLQTFDGAPVYADGGGVTDGQKHRRIARYWRPYHDEIAESLGQIRRQFGYALLWDAHSIRGTVPRLFEGELPDLNIGTNGGKSCPEAIAAAIAEVGEDSPYSCVVNGRFTGGYITRHYGNPHDGVFAVQLELAQRCYMNERTHRYDAKRAAALGDTLRRMLDAFRQSAAEFVAV